MKNFLLFYIFLLIIYIAYILFDISDKGRMAPNPYDHLKKDLEVGGQSYKYFDLNALGRHKK